MNNFFDVNIVDIYNLSMYCIIKRNYVYLVYYGVQNKF